MDQCMKKYRAIWMAQGYRTVKSIEQPKLERIIHRTTYVLTHAKLNPMTRIRLEAFRLGVIQEDMERFQTARS